MVETTFISTLPVYGMLLESPDCFTLVSEFTFPSINFSALYEAIFRVVLGMYLSRFQVFNVILGYYYLSSISSQVLVVHYVSITWIAFASFIFYVHHILIFVLPTSVNEHRIKCSICRSPFVGNSMK
jgi:hypothetical protein